MIGEWDASKFQAEAVTLDNLNHNKTKITSIRLLSKTQSLRYLGPLSELSVDVEGRGLLYPDIAYVRKWLGDSVNFKSGVNFPIIGDRLSNLNSEGPSSSMAQCCPRRGQLLLEVNEYRLGFNLTQLCQDKVNWTHKFSMPEELADTSRISNFLRKERFVFERAWLETGTKSEYVVELKKKWEEKFAK